LSVERSQRFGGLGRYNGEAGSSSTSFAELACRARPVRELSWHLRVRGDTNSHCVQNWFPVKEKSSGEKEP
jgi:hypothetical protein